jgi:hypothetical protein
MYQLYILNECLQINFQHGIMNSKSNILGRYMRKMYYNI